MHPSIIRIPKTLNIKDRSLDIYLGGPGFGEGMFIVIGKTIGIGIDCCPSFIRRRGGNESFLQQKVRELPSDGVLLWILTHYHYDHYHCLPAVLKLFSSSIKATLFPFDYNPADVSYLAEQYSEFPGEPIKVHRAQKEYKDLRSLLKLAPFTHTVSRAQGLLQWLSKDLILPNHEVIPLSVRICGCASDVYDNQIGMSVAEVRNQGSSTSRQNANRGSYIVHFGLGEFEGLFLGDAGTERVEQLVRDELIGERGIDCLKVGHHGSLDATNENLLKLCARLDGNRKEQHAMIAPYRRAGLPNDEIIELLKTFGYTVHISGGAKGSSEVEKNIRKEGSMLTRIDVSEAVATGSDIISLKLGF